MKKILSAILAVLTVCTTAAAVVSAAAKVDGRPTAEAYIAEVTVDGKIDDAWKYANEYAVATIKPTACDAAWYKNTMKAGKDYAAVTMKVLWDGKGTLYVLGQVKDSTPNLKYQKTNTYCADSFEVMFNLDNTKQVVAPTQWCWLADGKQTNGTTKFGYAKTADGFIMEVAVDVSKVGGAGQYLGFDVQYNDNVLGKESRQVCMAWRDATNNTWKDSSALGQCLLSAKKVSDIKAAQTTAATTKAPTAKPAAPATFDAAVILAVVTAAAGTGIVVSRKKH